MWVKGFFQSFTTVYYPRNTEQSVFINQVCSIIFFFFFFFFFNRGQIRYTRRDVSIKTTFLSSKLISYKGYFFKKAYTSPSGNGIYKDQNHSSIRHQGFEDSLQSQDVFSFSLVLSFWESQSIWWSQLCETSHASEYWRNKINLSQCGTRQCHFWKRTKILGTACEFGLSLISLALSECMSHLGLSTNI